MISTTAEYALRAMLLLANQPDRASMRSDEIADSIGAPRNYMSKTLRTMAHARLVTSNRGPNGGFRIASDPDRLKLDRLVELFDATPDDSPCLVPDCACTPGAPCIVNKWWQGVHEGPRRQLEATSLGRLLRSWNRARVREAKPRKRIPAARARR